MAEKEMWAGKSTDEVFGIGIDDGVLYNVHPAEQCEGRPCVLHNPSDHHMRSWPTLFRADLGIMERTCSHGVGHPDPDDMDWHESQGRGSLGTHGCDGCCAPPTD